MKKVVLLLLVVSLALVSMVGCDINELFSGLLSGTTTTTQKQDPPPVVEDLTAPVLTLSGNKVTWEAVENADVYDIYVNGEKEKEQSEALYSFEGKNVGTYEVYVIARCADGSFNNSPASNTVAYIVTPVALAKPVLTITGNVVSWEPVANAEKYEVSVNGTVVGEITDTQYAVEASEIGEYSVTVKAITSNENFLDSEASDAVVYEKTPTTLAAPVISIDGKRISWTAVDNASSYSIVIDGVAGATTENAYYDVELYGKHTFAVIALSASSLYGSSEASNTIPTNFFDVTKPFYVSGNHFNNEWVLGLATQENVTLLGGAREDVAKKMENFITNMRINPALGESALAGYAWQLEEVVGYSFDGATQPGYPVYRIRLTNGLYLTSVKQDYTGLGRDFVCAAEYVADDIDQYWQIIPVEGGKENEFHIIGVAHNYDWRKTDYLADTSEANGSPCFNGMNDGNKSWFTWSFTNVEATFEEVKHEDLSGSYLLHNFGTNNIHSFDGIDPFLKSIGVYDANNDYSYYSMTLEKVEYKGMHNVYRIKFGNGKYLYLGRNWQYELKDLDENVEDGGLGQLFVIDKVGGVMNGFYIGHIYLGTFNDYDGIDRYFAIRDNNGYASRNYNALDWRLHLPNIWNLIPYSAPVPMPEPEVLDAPVITLDGNTVSWSAVANADVYDVYINGEKKAEQAALTFVLEGLAEGTYEVSVKARRADGTYLESAVSNKVCFTVESELPEGFDITKPFYVSGKHYNYEWVLGILTQNAESPDAAHAEILAKMNNYICNMNLASLDAASLASYAWQLEEVEGYNYDKVVMAGYSVYRIRLTNGLYLTNAKQDYTTLGRDFICAAEYVADDIDQYWQVIPVEGGAEGEYHIINLAHNLDWNTTHYLGDTSQANGGPEYNGMNDGNKDWFTWKFTNINASFDEVYHEDLSGDYLLHNFGTNEIFGFASGDDFLKAIGIYDANADYSDYTMTLEKVEYNGMHNVYRIKFGENKYLFLGRDWKYEVKPLDENVNDGGLGQLFVIDKVGGPKGIMINIGHIYYGQFTDYDGVNRYYAISGADTYAHRQYNAFDWRLHLQNLWKLIPRD